MLKLFINHWTLSKDAEVKMITLSLLRIQNMILQILDGPLILIPSFNAFGVRGIPMKRILWKGRMVEICVQFAVIFGPFLQVGFNDAAVGRTLNVTHCKSCNESVH